MKKPQSQRGVALLEAVMAAMLLAIGLLGTIGMQAKAYSALSDANMRAEATIATEKLLGLMANDVTNVNSYALASGGAPDARISAWYTETRTNIPNAIITVVVTPAAGTTRSRVDVTLSWTLKAGGQQNTHRVTSYISQSS